MLTKYFGKTKIVIRKKSQVLFVAMNDFLFALSKAYWNRAPGCVDEGAGKYIFLIYLPAPIILLLGIYPKIFINK